MHTLTWLQTNLEKREDMGPLQFAMWTYIARNLPKHSRKTWTYKGINQTAFAPQGVWVPYGNQKIWYPKPVEVCECCKYITSVKPAYGWQYQRHCRTIKHVAQLIGVSEKELRLIVGKQKPARMQCRNCSKFLPDAYMEGWCQTCFELKCAECSRPRVRKDYLCEVHRTALDTVALDC